MAAAAAALLPAPPPRKQPIGRARARTIIEAASVGASTDEEARFRQVTRAIPRMLQGDERTHTVPAACDTPPA